MENDSCGGVTAGRGGSPGRSQERVVAAAGRGLGEASFGRSTFPPPRLPLVAQEVSMTHRGKEGRQKPYIGFLSSQRPGTTFTS